MKTRYNEKGSVISKFEYEFVGYGINAQPIYAEYVTRFSITKGVIESRVFVRNVTEACETYESYVR